jgi:hypothetical protein
MGARVPFFISSQWQESFGLYNLASAEAKCRTYDNARAMHASKAKIKSKTRAAEGYCY